MVVFKAAPLSNGFMIASMLGFILTAVYTSSGRFTPSWGFTFGLVFVIMFIASVISMTHAPVEAELQIDMPRKRREEAAKKARRAKKTQF